MERKSNLERATCHASGSAVLCSCERISKCLKIFMCESVAEYPGHSKSINCGAWFNEVASVAHMKCRRTVQVGSPHRTCRVSFQVGSRRLQTTVQSTTVTSWNQLPIGSSNTGITHRTAQIEAPFRCKNWPSVIARGEISAESLVWAEGMPGWKPAGDIPELRSHLPFTRGHAVSEAPVMVDKSDNAHSDADSTMILSASQPLAWLRFITWFLIVFSTSSLVLGIWLTATGFQKGADGAILGFVTAKANIQTGLTLTGIAVTTFYGGFLLNGFRIAVAEFARTKKNLAAVFQKLQGVVIYVSILLILYLVGIILLIIELVSTTGATP